MSQAPKITVRGARSDDVPTLGRLGALLVALHHDYDPDRFIAPGPRTERGYGSFLASELDRKDAIVLVAEDRNAVLGYAYAGLEGNDWMALRGPAGVIHDLVVDPERRHEGIGRTLLHAMLGALADRGAPRVVLSAATRNEAAQRLFAAMGFRPTMIEMTREWPD
jgi:ribosomal protein S18 acetylase RimI-like enzyme